MDTNDQLPIIREGNVVKLPFQFYVSSAEAIPAFMAAKQLEAFAKLLPQTRKLMGKLLRQDVPNQTEVLFDRLVPGGSKDYIGWANLICPSEEAAINLANAIKEWAMEHPYLFTTICLTLIVCWPVVTLSKKYLDDKRQEHATEQANKVIQALAEQLKMNAESLATIAKEALASNNTLMRTVAELVAPIKRTGGFAKIGTKESGILLPEPLIQAMPTPDEIHPEPNDVVIPISAAKVKVIASNLRNANSGWSVSFVEEESSYGDKPIKAKLDESHGVATTQMMYKEFVTIDGELQCKAKGAKLNPQLLIIHAVHKAP